MSKGEGKEREMGQGEGVAIERGKWRISENEGGWEGKRDRGRKEMCKNREKGQRLRGFEDGYIEGGWAECVSDGDSYVM